MCSLRDEEGGGSSSTDLVARTAILSAQAKNFEHLEKVVARHLPATLWEPHLHDRGDTRRAQHERGPQRRHRQNGLTLDKVACERVWLEAERYRMHPRCVPRAATEADG